jgi:hypothetical protein
MCTNIFVGELDPMVGSLLCKKQTSEFRAKGQSKRDSPTVWTPWQAQRRLFDLLEQAKHSCGK